MALSNLPKELLELISNYLDRSSLLGLSLVARPCREASTLSIFRPVKLKFSSPASLAAAVDGWQNLLDSSQSFCHVRHLQVLAGCLYRYPRDFEQGTRDHPIDTWKFCFVDQSQSTPVTNEQDWEVLARFVQLLPAVLDLTWGCSEQTPRCILNLIRQRQCRLHMQNFCLRSLVQPRDAPLQISPDDLELATFPYLYSLTMRYEYDSGFANYNKDAIMDMVAGAAKNLRKVSILSQSGGSDPWRVQASNVRRKQWQAGTIPKPNGQMIIGALQALTLNGRSEVDHLERWSKVTDLTCLHTLSLHTSLGIAALQWMTTHCHFPSLKALVIALDGEDDPFVSADQYADTAEAFLDSLRPLRSLTISGSCLHRTVEHAIKRHGHSLKAFHLNVIMPRFLPESFADAGFLNALRTICPIIEEVTLPILRSQGDWNEVAIYKALGRMRSLRKIRLRVYAPQSLLWNEARLWSAADVDLEMLKDAIISLAIDERLGRLIFRTISSAKEPYASPLEYLEYNVVATGHEGGFDSSSEAIKLLFYIGRSYVCHRVGRDDCPHQCLVEDYDKEATLDRQEIEDHAELQEYVDRHFGSVLQSVWPECSERDWKSAWHSFPLAESPS